VWEGVVFDLRAAEFIAMDFESWWCFVDGEVSFLFALHRGGHCEGCGVCAGVGG
jgi:hypothetical protein